MSDSESSNDDDYTRTNVILGYPCDEPLDDEITHLGGKPSWIDSSSPPSAALAKCKVCNDLMVLLLQLNGELPDFQGHERRLYVLTCRRKTCRRKEGSVRVLRGVRITEVAPPKEKKKEMVPAAAKPAFIGESLFGATTTTSNSSHANPFSSNSGSSASSSNPFSSGSANANPFASTSELAAKPPQKPVAPADLPQTFAAALNLNNDAPKSSPPPPPEPWPQDSDIPAPYPVYYLDSDYEELDAVSDIAIPAQAMEIDESGSGGGGGGGKEDKEVYESTIDTTFQKFADRVEQNPEQVLRYEFRGTPLLYSKKDTVGKLLSGGKGEGKVKVGGSSTRIPRCSNCGAGRVFEAQLTPHAIMKLERDESGLDGMEWGTIILETCEKDCQERGVEKSVGYVEEWVGVQWEELSEKR